jgi:hypothetical protein
MAETVASASATGTSLKKVGASFTGAGAEVEAGAVGAKGGATRRSRAKDDRKDAAHRFCIGKKVMTEERKSREKERK